MVLWKARRHSRRSGSGKTSVLPEWKGRDFKLLEWEGHDFRGCGKTQFARTKRPRGLKPAHISDDLRGPEGPLFHGRADISEFFRNHFSRAEKARAKSALAAGVSLVPLEAPYHPNSQPRALKAQPGLRAGAARLKSCPSRTVPFPGRPARFIPRGRMTMAAPTGARRAAARSSGIWDRNGSRRRRARPSHT